MQWLTLTWLPYESPFYLVKPVNNILLIWVEINILSMQTVYRVSGEWRETFSVSTYYQDRSTKKNEFFDFWNGGWVEQFCVQYCPCSRTKIISWVEEVTIWKSCHWNLEKIVVKSEKLYLTFFRPIVSGIFLKKFPSTHWTPCIGPCLYFRYELDPYVITKKYWLSQERWLFSYWK